MSSDQANTYKKQRAANDATGNLTWAARVTQKGLRISPGASASVETDFDFTDDEKVLWRLMRIPRRYIDLEHVGLLPIEVARSFFRGLVAAEVVEVLEPGEAKALVPVEVDRLKREVSGGGAAPARRAPMKARVYRPPVDGVTAREEAAPEEAPAAQAPEPAPAPTPKARAPMQAAAAPVTDAAMTAEERELKDLVSATYDAMKAQNHYEFLGLNQGVDDAGVRAAYVRKARELHPDRYASGSLKTRPEVQGKVDTLFKHLQEVYAVLSHADQRANYDRNLAAHPVQQNTGERKKARRPEEAAVLFTKGEHLAKAKQWKQAETHLRTAAELDWEDPKILTSLAWCIFQNDEHEKEDRFNEAKRRLDEVAKKYKFADASYKLALIARIAGDEETAHRRFTDTLKYDANHVEAGREKRIAEMRQKKDAADKKYDKSLLGKILKR